MGRSHDMVWYGMHGNVLFDIIIQKYKHKYIHIYKYSHIGKYMSGGCCWHVATKV